MSGQKTQPPDARLFRLTAEGVSQIRRFWTAFHASRVQRAWRTFLRKAMRKNPEVPESATVIETTGRLDFEHRRLEDACVLHVCTVLGVPKEGAGPVPVARWISWDLRPGRSRGTNASQIADSLKEQAIELAQKSTRAVLSRCFPLREMSYVSDKPPEETDWLPPPAPPVKPTKPVAAITPQLLKQLRQWLSADLRSLARTILGDAEDLLSQYGRNLPESSGWLVPCEAKSCLLNLETRGPQSLTIVCWLYLVGQDLLELRVAVGSEFLDPPVHPKSPRVTNPRPRSGAWGS